MRMPFIKSDKQTKATVRSGSALGDRESIHFFGEWGDIYLNLIAKKDLLSKIITAMLSI